MEALVVGIGKQFAIGDALHSLLDLDPRVLLCHLRIADVELDGILGILVIINLKLINGLLCALDGSP